MEPLLSQIILFAGSGLPAGYMVCDGSALEQSQNVALFSLIGHTYGGSGNTFNLPNIPAIGSARYLISINGSYPEFER